MRSRVYVTVEPPSVRLYHCSTAAVATGGLLLNAQLEGNIDPQLPVLAARRRVPDVGALSSNGAAARRSAANVGSVMLTAERRC